MLEIWNKYHWYISIMTFGSVKISCMVATGWYRALGKKWGSLYLLYDHALNLIPILLAYGFLAECTDLKYCWSTDFWKFHLATLCARFLYQHVKTKLFIVQHSCWCWMMQKVFLFPRILLSFTYHSPTFPHLNPKIQTIGWQGSAARC